MSTAVPSRLQPQEVTVVRPAETTNAYGDVALDYGTGATRTEIDGWLQQDQRVETHPDGRNPLVGTWTLVTNHQDIGGDDRIEWTGPAGALTFSVDGPPEPTYTPGGYHHTEVTLQIVEG